MANKLDKQARVEKTEFEIFEFALTLKLVNAALELAGGIVIFLVPPRAWQKLILLLTQHELATDPTDFIANYFRSYASGLTIKGEHFLGLFLISHGIVKLFLIFSLLRKKLWAYPVSIAVFSGFIIYQIYEYFHTYHYSLLFLSALDLAIVIFAILEYNNLRKVNERSQNGSIKRG